MGLPNLMVIASAGSTVGLDGAHYSVFVEVLNPKNGGRGLVLGYGKTETIACEAAEAKVEELKKIHPMLTIVDYHS